MAERHSSRPLRTAYIDLHGSRTVVLPSSGCRSSESICRLFIRRDGERLVLTPRPSDGSVFFNSGLNTSAYFATVRERMPIQERVVRRSAY